MKKSILTLLLLSSSMGALATTPSGSWTLKNKTSNVKDYFMRIDVDPGERYSDYGFAPSSVYWAQYITFETPPNATYSGYGYLGLQRFNGNKLAIASIWGGSGAKGGVIPAVDCFEFDYCTSIKGDYEWKVGHNYRFRVEKSPRTPSDSSHNWWQISLADLTKGTVEVLGELKTPASWGGMKTTNNVFLEYFQGPYECSTLRHSKTTLGQIRGNYGKDSELAGSHGNSYAAPHHCGQNYILPSMPQSKYDSASWITNGTITMLGNTYRGIHLWDDYQNNAKTGMFFAKNPNAEQPYIYRALHDGKFGYFPPEGSDNSHWKSIGKGYPIINDLFFRNQKVYEWEERHNANVKIGDFFIYNNPYNGDTEYFKLKQLDPKNETDDDKIAYYPINKSDNAFWTYVGRYSKSNEKLNADLPVKSWVYNDKSGKKNTLYFYERTNMYFTLKNDGAYSYFPTTATDNQWWTFVGYNR